MTKRPARKKVADRLRGPRSDTASAKREAPPVSNVLNPAQHAFALEYLENGFNATQAYLKAYPEATYDTARNNGARLLANACIRDFLKPQLDAHWKSLQMDGEEALARIALLCTLDLADFFDENHCLKSPQDWPARAGQLLESVDWEKGKVKIGSRLQALRTLLEVTGKIKNPTADDAIRDLATILAEKFKG